jgi:hypothetical protein
MPEDAPVTRATERASDRWLMSSPRSAEPGRTGSLPGSIWTHDRDDRRPTPTPRRTGPPPRSVRISGIPRLAAPPSLGSRSVPR